MIVQMGIIPLCYLYYQVAFVANKGQPYLTEYRLAARGRTSVDIATLVHGKYGIYTATCAHFLLTFLKGVWLDRLRDKIDK